MIQMLDPGVKSFTNPYPEQPSERRRSDRISLLAIEHVVSRAFGGGLTALPIHAHARRESVRIRHIAIYLHHVVCGATLTDIGCAHHRDRTTAAYACRVVEDLRDDPQFDFTLEVLEKALVAILGRV